VMTRNASTAAWAMARDWVATMIFRFGQRSTSTPATGDMKNAGIWVVNPTTPSKVSELVSRYTSHCIAMVCIHVPMSEMPWPTKKSW